MRFPLYPFTLRTPRPSPPLSSAEHPSPDPIGIFRIFPPSPASSPRLDTLPPPTYDASCLPPSPIPTPHVDDKQSEVSVVVLLREDYRATLIYAREFEWKVATRKAVRRHMYSQLRPTNTTSGFGLTRFDFSHRMVPHPHSLHRLRRPARPETRTSHPILPSFDKKDTEMASRVYDSGCDTHNPQLSPSRWS